MRAAKVAAGGTIQRGRPKMIKDNTIEVIVKTKAPKASKVAKTETSTYFVDEA